MHLPPMVQEIGSATVAKKHKVIAMRGRGQNVANQVIALISIVGSRKYRHIKHGMQIAILLHSCSEIPSFYHVNQ